MIDDNSPHRIFKISELTRLIASHTLAGTSPTSAVNLACACRYLEEPVLSTLWERQLSFESLLKVLPEANWECDSLVSGEKVVCDLESPVWESERSIVGVISVQDR